MEKGYGKQKVITSHSEKVMENGKVMGSQPITFDPHFTPINTTYNEKVIRLCRLLRSYFGEGFGGGLYTTSITLITFITFAPFHRPPTAHATL